MNEFERHNDAEELLCDYLDGRLSHRQRRLLEKRLEQDGDLREQLRQYGVLDGMFDQLGESDAEGFDFDQQRSEIVAAAERKVLLGPKRYRPVYLRPVFMGLAAAASLLLLAGAAFLLTRPPVVGMSQSAPAVSVYVLPVANAPIGREVVSVTLSAPSGQAYQPPQPTTSNAAVPRGTVVVSTGAHRHAKATPADAMMIY